MKFNNSFKAFLISLCLVINSYIQPSQTQFHQQSPIAVPMPSSGSQGNVITAPPSNAMAAWQARQSLSTPTSSYVPITIEGLDEFLKLATPLITQAGRDINKFIRQNTEESLGEVESYNITNLNSSIESLKKFVHFFNEEFTSNAIHQLVNTVQKYKHQIIGEDAHNQQIDMKKFKQDITNIFDSVTAGSLLSVQSIEAALIREERTAGTGQKQNITNLQKSLNQVVRHIHTTLSDLKLRLFSMIVSLKKQQLDSQPLIPGSPHYKKNSSVSNTYIGTPIAKANTHQKMLFDNENNGEIERGQIMELVIKGIKTLKNPSLLVDSANKTLLPAIQSILNFDATLGRLPIVAQTDPIDADAYPGITQYKNNAINPYQYIINMIEATDKIEGGQRNALNALIGFANVLLALYTIEYDRKYSYFHNRPHSDNKDTPLLKAIVDEANRLADIAKKITGPDDLLGSNVAKDIEWLISSHDSKWRYVSALTSSYARTGLKGLAAAGVGLAAGAAIKYAGSGSGN